MINVYNLIYSSGTGEQDLQSILGGMSQQQLMQLLGKWTFEQTKHFIKVSEKCQ